MAFAGAVSPALLAWLVRLVTGIQLNLFESGTVLAGGERLFHGDVPYTDFFAFYGPLTYAIPAALFHVLGTNVSAILLSDLVLSCASAAASFGVARMLSDRAWIAYLTPWVMVFAGAASLRTLPAILMVLCLARFETTRSARWAVLAGAMTAVGILWFQDSGVFMIASVLVITLSAAFFSKGPRLSRINVGGFSAGALTIFLPVLGWLAAEGALGRWFYYCFIFPNTVYTDRSATGYVRELVSSWAGSSLSSLGYKATFYFAPYPIAFLAAAVVFGAGLWALFRNAPITPVPWTTAIFGTYALLQLRVLLASLDESKLADTIGPTIILSLCIAGNRLSQKSFHTGQWWRGPGRSPWSVVSLLAVAWFLVWPLQRYVHGVVNLERATASSASGRLGGIPIAGGGPPSTSTSELSLVVRAIQQRTAPNDKIFITPIEPMMYVLADRANVTRYDYLDPVYTTSVVDGQIADALSTDRAKIVVVAATDFPGGTISGSQLAPATYSAISSHYRPIQQIGAWTIMVWAG